MSDTAYQKLSKWARRNNMMFKVEDVDNDDNSCTLWMCDAADGYTGAECVVIHDNYPTWLGFRFRLKKNEQFVNMFLEEDKHTNCDWQGHTEPKPKFTMPRYYQVTGGHVGKKDGRMFFLCEQPDEATENQLAEEGCELLWSSPQYAPEIKRRVVFVPEDLAFAYQ